jgi:hypothetical protein
MRLLNGVKMKQDADGNGRSGEALLLSFEKTDEDLK